MDKFFHLKENGTNVKREIVAGFTTFFTMAYIIFVNPDMLNETGMSWEGVFCATCLSALVGTLIMALFANVPYAVAPGMGLNALFTYTVCLTGGFTWREALAMVFICGIINIIITVTKLRKAIVRSIPDSLKNAIGCGIGLFIAYLGLINSGIVTFGSGTPAMATFNVPSVLLTVIGIIIMVVLMIMNVKGAILIGIIATTIIGIPLKVTQIPTSIFSGAHTWEGFKEVSFAFFGADGFGNLFSNPKTIPFVIVSIFSMSLSDTFDSVGTFIGTSKKSHIFEEEDLNEVSSSGIKTKLDKALVADSFATSLGALFGTSNATTYVESASGIAAGGRTGLTSLTTAILFLLCLPFSGLFGMVPSAATAPALIIVGILMAEPFAEINWKDIQEAIPAFFTVAIMSFTYGITNGIAAGFIMYCLTKIFTKKAKEIHPIIIGASILFVIDFLLKALQGAGII